MFNLMKFILVMNCRNQYYTYILTKWAMNGLKNRLIKNIGLEFKGEGDIYLISYSSWVNPICDILVD